MTTLSRAEVAVRIRKLAESVGGPEKLARKLDVTTEYVGHVIKGKRPGPKVLKLAGIIETGGIYREMEKK